MGWEAAAIVGGANLLGGYLQGSAAQSAAETSSNAQLQAANTATEAQKFRPVGITTNFGRSAFEFNPQGYLSGANYQLSPELQAQQEQIMGGARQNLSDAQMLSNLGRSYISANPQEVAANWLAKQNALLAPQRELQRAKIQQGLFNTGRSGLSVAQGGGLGAANPEMQAYYNAIAQQDAQNALNAQQYGQQQLTFGQGLLTGAYAPYQTALGTAQSVEQLGQSPLDIGAQLGGRSATAGANIGNTLFSAGTNAARTMQQANAYSPLGSTISGMANNPFMWSALANRQQTPQQYNPYVPGQYTPGSDTYVGPMPQMSWYD